MTEVSLFRLYLLRAMYLLIVVGLGAVVWPGFLMHDAPWGLTQSVVASMLVAFSLLSALGLRYPLQMLPVLMWELVWKTVWLLTIALPLWRSGQMNDAFAGTAAECLVAILIPLVMPWRYVYTRYLKQAGDRWR